MTRLWWGLIRLGFHLLYNQLAFTYDWVSWIVSLGAWRCWIRASLKHLNVQPGALILELAHGTGNLQLDLHEAGYRAIGYDLSPAMGRIAQRKLRRRGLPARLARGRAQTLPFPAESFDAVISTFPTDFITAQDTVREVYRVLKPGGVLVVVPTALLTGSGWSARALERLYQITGQREASVQLEDHDEDEDIAALFAPFQVTVVNEASPRSLVTVIVARKSPEKGLESA